MPRTETKIMTDWTFALGETEPKAEKFLPVTLPHDWAIDMPISREMKECEPQGFYDRWSIGWYKKTLNLTEKKAGYLYYLDFGGIFEKSTIWVNDTLAGESFYGYSSFKIDVTPYVKEGDNKILIKVDNTTSPADRWYSGCGIYRTVTFIETEEKHFEKWDISVVTKLLENKGATVTVNLPYKQRVEAKLKFDSQIVVTGEKNADGNITLTVASPLLWTSDTPNLYDLELNMYDKDRMCDTINFKVGIREIEFVGEGRDKRAGMYVNKKRETLKGVCVHQDVGCRGIAAKKEVWRDRLLTLKEMGCNCVRTAHHVFSSEFLDLCDELGFYVYDECFDKWVFGAYERYFNTYWQKDVDAMVKRDRNHPSVVIWGVGNEETNQGQTSMLNILKMLCDYVKTIDNTRPVTYAMKPHFNYDVEKNGSIVVEKYDERIEYAAKIGEIVDIVCCNYMDQWYEKLHKLLPKKLIIGTEVYQYFAGAPDNMQNFDVKVPSLVPERLDYCIGSMIWTGIDYLGESAGYPFRGRSNSPLRTNMEKRPMFYILQSYWREEPMVHFSVMDYSLQDEGSKWHWSIPPYADHWHFPQVHKVMIPYIVVSNCDEVEIYLNGSKYLLPRPKDCENRIINGFLPYLPGVVKVVGLIDGKEVCSYETHTPDFASSLRFDKEVYHCPAEEGYEKLITVRAVDKDGHPVFRDTSLVEFTVEGDAEVIATDNADFKNEEPYSSNMKHLFQGQCSVLVRLHGKKGRVIVKANSSGLYSAETTIICE
ncbi:MAG: glycoside hydrolase family 2 protein [Ruminococcaceae bacterium]|nr:glycoside hydrolase family 2 protein [Oscillospiraceae bacterium]